MSQKRCRVERDDTIKSGKILDTLEKMPTSHELYSTFTFGRHNFHHRQHHYRRREKGYFIEDLKKAKPPTFYG